MGTSPYVEVFLPNYTTNPLNYGFALIDFDRSSATHFSLGNFLTRINTPSGDRIVNIFAMGKFRDGTNYWDLSFRARLPFETGDYLVR